jgi:hypothetical protein
MIIVVIRIWFGKLVCKSLSSRFKTEKGTGVLKENLSKQAVRG